MDTYSIWSGVSTFNESAVHQARYRKKKAALPCLRHRSAEEASLTPLDKDLCMPCVRQHMACGTHHTHVRMLTFLAETSSSIMPPWLHKNFTHREAAVYLNRVARNWAPLLHCVFEGHHGLEQAYFSRAPQGPNHGVLHGGDFGRNAFYLLCT